MSPEIEVSFASRSLDLPRASVREERPAPSPGRPEARLRYFVFEFV